MAIIDTGAKLDQALAKGSVFAVNKGGNLETLGFWGKLHRGFMDKFLRSPETIMDRDRDIVRAMSKFVSSSNSKVMPGPANPETLREKLDLVLPFEKLAAMKNHIAEIYVQKKLTVKTLMSRHGFSLDDASRVHECMLDNTRSGFLRPMLEHCNGPDDIHKFVDNLVAATKNKHGAFLMGLDQNNSFPKIWQDIKRTKLCDVPNLTMDSILGKVFKDFEDWSKSDSGKTADKSDMALWLKNTCPTIRTATAVYPRNHGYSAYSGSFKDKMRIGSLLQNDPNNIAFAMDNIGNMRELGAPRDELTPKDVWKGTFYELMPRDVNEDNFSSKFSEKVDEWFKVPFDVIYSRHLTDDELSLMRRMVKDFRPHTVNSIMKEAICNSGSSNMRIDNSLMIDPKATLTLVPAKGKTPIESILRDIAHRPPVMKPGREGTIVPHTPILSIENNRFPVGDTDNWGGKTSVKVGANGLGETTFRNGPEDGGVDMAFSDDDIKKYSEGSDLSKYAQSIRKAVQDVCGIYDRQFDAVMQLLSNDTMNHIIGDEGILHGLPGVSLIKPSGFDMTINREPNGSVKVQMTSGQPVNQNGWRMSVTFLVAWDGSSGIPVYNMEPAPLQSDPLR